MNIIGDYKYMINEEINEKKEIIRLLLLIFLIIIISLSYFHYFQTL